ncbi:uncharacterized protein LOC124921364 [Impatiens glandulifera]|uniref:uncharacterized protein LOC124921364 n=1 Tax=Impatiens glandulifera TaxID=253017 RepID=UPI001FB1707A|nr:uncharacterized protein LOC124921364 [Impatiens glandulifera]
MASELDTGKNPRTWRFTWEAQSHVPSLKLFLFNLEGESCLQFKNLKVDLLLEQSLLTVCWFEGDEVSIKYSVPIPKVLIDTEYPFHVKAMDDHIEVRLVLLLPVDDPILTKFEYGLTLEDGESPRENVPSDCFGQLLMGSDFKDLSSVEGGVTFHCRNCSTVLTKSIKFFVEMPSSDWSEVADNWFGGCCCSFGGIGEKLITKYASSYSCTEGKCLCHSAFVVLNVHDFVGCTFPTGDDDESQEETQDPDLVNHINHVNEDLTGHVNGFSESGLELCSTSCCHSEMTNISIVQKSKETVNLLVDQKSFLNGFIGNIFMLRSSNITKNVQWKEFSCPNCSSFLGAFPCSDDYRQVSIDGGIRLFKCSVSTCQSVNRSKDLFGKYTLQRMFTNQLLESAKDELSFRTVIRNLQTMPIVLQLILFNPNIWYATGDCTDFGSYCESIGKLDMMPAIKVLFQDYSGGSESQLRLMEEWVKKNEADEVFMMCQQLKELIRCLEFSSDIYPPSHSSLQGLSLSLLRK